MSILKLVRPVFNAAALLGVLVGSLALARDPSQDLAQYASEAQDHTAVAVKEYDVFVDLPTAFAFIKLPSGWKFIGKLDASQLDNLPPGTLTALLQPEEGPTRLAEAAQAPVMLARGIEARVD